MNPNQIITLVAFAFYMVLMIAIGVFYSKKTNNNEDYFLGGRNLGGWTAALSAQASDMSGWLLMGLPGAVYLAGTGEIWIAVGLLIGTILNWYIVSSRLRKYTIVAGNSLTIPSFFENRYRDKKGVIKIVSAIIIAAFTVVEFVVTTCISRSSAFLYYNHALSRATIAVVEPVETTVSFYSTLLTCSGAACSITLKRKCNTAAVAVQFNNSKLVNITYFYNIHRVFYEAV